jgi:hypothetical protein
MAKETQRQRVIKKLLKDGFVTRNECLRNFMSRLGAVIQVLEDEGWEFDAKYLPTSQGNDYIYKVIKCPLTRVEYTLPNGEKVTTYK